MSSKIPHSKPTVSNVDLEAVQMQVSSGMHATGTRTEEFEKVVADYIGMKFARAVNSGTNALHLALLSLDVGKGDEVIIPSYVCQSLLNAVNYTGATPVMVDVQEGFIEKGFNISAETIKPQVTKKTKAIIVPHMFGVSAQIEEIIKLGIPVIEDCAQSLGAEYNGKNKKGKIGSFGDISIFSFYATKPISTGQGGMILTNSKKIKDKLDDLTQYDQREKYKIAYNFTLTDIQSSLGISQLTRLDDFIKIRKKIADRYNEAFKNLPIKIAEYKNGAYTYRYIIQLKDSKQAKQFQEFLKSKEISTVQPVFLPLHNYLNLKQADFKNSTEAHETILSLPIYPSLKQEEIERVINSVKEFFKN